MVDDGGSDLTRLSQASRASDQRFKALVQATSEVLYRMSADWGEMRQLEGGSFLSTTSDPSRAWLMNYIPRAEQPRVTAAIEAAIRSKSVFELEHQVCRVDGSIGWTLSRAVPLLDDDGEISEWFGAASDVTARRTAEQTLRQLNQELEQRVEERSASLRLFENIVRSDPAPMAAFDRDMRLTAFNDAHDAYSKTLFGCPAAIGDHLPDHLTSDQAASLRSHMQRALAGEAFTIREEFGNSDRSCVLWDIRFNPLRDEGGNTIGGFHHALDVTAEVKAERALRKSEDALRQAQKMQAIGQLTGGIAHDFNNLLTGIMGNLELLQIRLAQGRLQELDEFIIAAEGSGRRAAALTHRLLAFARRQTLDPKPTDVNRLVAGMEDLLRRTVGPAYAIEIVGAAGLWTTNIDAGQLENALLNLCINSRDAMPDGGRLTIETANKWLDENAARERDLLVGQYLAVCVTDAGSGMDSVTIERAFEPFFTTKPTGQGTGLGLSMVYGFARQSNGQVRIYSEVGMGTTICIYLPRHIGKGEPISLQEPADQVERGQAGRILLVEDDPVVRRLVEEALHDLEYVVIGAADGAAGLDTLRALKKVELLITDVGLPNGMNGRQVADAARELQPGLKILFITGYAENAAVGNGHLEPGMELLTKPFTLRALAQRVSALTMS